MYALGATLLDTYKHINVLLNDRLEGNMVLSKIFFKMIEDVFGCIGRQ